MRDYRKIGAWQKADDLVVMVYKSTKSYPREEIYGLTSQLRRAAYSVPSNIAEGSARNTLRDYLHFLYMARGSLAEVQYFLHLSLRLGYIKQEDYDSMDLQVKQSFAALYGLIEAVEKEAGPVVRAASRLTSWLWLLFPLHHTFPVP